MKTPQQKAKELVDRFLPEVRGADRYNYNLEEMNVFIAKQCAKIAVDEVLGFIEDDRDGFSWKIYYQQVKTELEK